MLIKSGLFPLKKKTVSSFFLQLRPLSVTLMTHTLLTALTTKTVRRKTKRYFPRRIAETRCLKHAAM